LEACGPGPLGSPLNPVLKGKQSIEVGHRYRNSHAIMGSHGVTFNVFYFFSVVFYIYEVYILQRLNPENNRCIRNIPPLCPDRGLVDRRSSVSEMQNTQSLLARKLVMA